jgi:transcriptional regulator with XRE-family HTH domain
MQFKEKLKNTRNNRNVSTQELADAISVSQIKVEN